MTNRTEKWEICRQMDERKYDKEKYTAKIKLEVE
jgi:hypothetical protein